MAACLPTIQIAESFTPSAKLDILGFDACLMAMVETGYAVAPIASLMVASEELEPGDGWQYADWLTQLAAQPTMSPQELGSAIVDTYADHYRDSYFTTLSLLDLSRVEDAARALTDLSDSIRAAGPGEIAAMRQARAEVSSYADWDTPPSYLSVDIVTLLERYRTHAGTDQLRQRADTTIAAVKGTVLDNYASLRSQGTLDDGLYGSKGLAIYYPASLQDFRGDYFHSGYLKQNTDRPIAFVRNERWADLLYVLLELQ